MNLISLRGSIVVGLGIGLVYVAWAWPALAHTTATGMTFTPWCCNGKDCQEIPRSAVEINSTSGMVKVTLRPGDHPKITKTQNYTFKYSEVRWSTDGLYYACLYPNEWTLRCLYLPPPSF